jgi:two-component system, chemotaxis family, response regulator Rcp1
MHVEGAVELLLSLLNTADFPRRWDCGRWSTGLGWLHIVSDLAIFAASLSLALALAYFLTRREVPFPRIIVLCGSLIVLCSFGHAVEAFIGIGIDPNFPSASSRSSSGCTPAVAIQEPESAWRSVRRSWSSMEARFGSTRKRAWGRRFTSRSRGAPRGMGTIKKDNERWEREIEILLVDDNAGDTRLTMEALKESKLLGRVSVAVDGEEALAFLRREGSYASAPRPDLILLDLNLPRKSGREVLEEIKGDPGLRRIPVVVLTSSNAEQDVRQSYDLHANCYVTKPFGVDQFIVVVRSIAEFWSTIVRFPSHENLKS